MTGGNPANQFNGTAFSVSHGNVEVDGAIHTGISSNLQVTFSYANINFSGKPEIRGAVTLKGFGNVVVANDGNTYMYVGPPGSVPLGGNDAQYQNGALWQLIPTDIVATVSNFSTSQATVTIQHGQIVEDSSTKQFYTYNGSEIQLDLGTIVFS